MYDDDDVNVYESYVLGLGLDWSLNNYQGHFLEMKRFVIIFRSIYRRCQFKNMSSSTPLFYVHGNVWMSAKEVI